MANDIGHVIWELAKSDITFDGRNLMNDFFKKIELDKRIIREKLRDMVLNHIKTKIQPFNTYITLEKDNDIFGSFPKVQIFEIDDNNRDELETLSKTNHYLKKCDKHVRECYIEIINSDTKYLIDNAIIPLNLTWSTTEIWGGKLIISWDHWIKNK